MTDPVSTHTAHTPTPWAVTDGQCVYALNAGNTNRFFFCVQGGHCDTDDKIRTPRNELIANAAFIVRACNNFDGLVKAVAEAARRLGHLEHEMHGRLTGDAATKFRSVRVTIQILTDAIGATEAP